MTNLYTLFWIWAYTLVLEEERQVKECHYDICSGYVDSYLEEGVCYCYDYDSAGEAEIVHTEVLK